MPLIDTGHGLYTVKNGKMVPADVTPISASINNQKLFHYDEGAGALKLNKEMVPEGILEQIVKQIKKGPRKGAEINLVLPFQGPVLVKDVKSVAYFTSEETVHKDKEEDLVQEIFKDNYRNQSKGFAKKLKDFFSKYNPFS